MRGVLGERMRNRMRKSHEFVWCVLCRRDHRFFLTHFSHVDSHAPLWNSHAVSHAAFLTQFLKQIDMGSYNFCVYELRLYGFAENRQPRQEKKSELKVNKQFMHFSFCSFIMYVYIYIYIYTYTHTHTSGRRGEAEARSFSYFNMYAY